MRKLIEFLIGFFTAFTITMNAYAVDYSSITVSDSDYTELIKVIAGESQNDTYEAQLAVVETIFNRCLDSRFPDTPIDVVSQKGQFSIWKIRNASWIEPTYGAKPLDQILATKESTILPDSSYVIFSTKKQRYGYDYIKIGKTYFGKMK